MTTARVVSVSSRFHLASVLLMAGLTAACGAGASEPISECQLELRYDNVEAAEEGAYDLVRFSSQLPAACRSFLQTNTGHFFVKLTAQAPNASQGALHSIRVYSEFEEGIEPRTIELNRATAPNFNVARLNFEISTTSSLTRPSQWQLPWIPVPESAEIRFEFPQDTPVESYPTQVTLRLSTQRASAIAARD